MISVKIFLCLVGTVFSYDWAFIAATTKGFWNYRYQLEAARQFHFYKNHGVEADKIILMMYNDITTDPVNRYPNKLYGPSLNVTSSEIVDYMKGLQISYSGSDVSASSFMNVLNGKAESPKQKVLDSSPSDRIFISILGLGAPGMVTFPNSVMSGPELLSVLENMHKTHKFHEMHLFLDMVGANKLLPSSVEEMNIFVHSPYDSPETEKDVMFASYCPPHDDLILHGSHFGTCMCSSYSSLMLSEIEFVMATRQVYKSLQPTGERLEELTTQYKASSAMTTHRSKEHRQRSAFRHLTSQGLTEMKIEVDGRTTSVQQPKSPKERGAWSKHDEVQHYDSKFEYLLNVVNANNEPAGLRSRAVQDELNIRKQMVKYIDMSKSLFREAVPKATSITEWECYKSGIERFSRIFQWHEYTLFFYPDIVDICESDPAFFNV